MRFFLSIIVFIGLISGHCHAAGPVGPAPGKAGADINADAGNPIQGIGRNITMDVTDADIRDILARIGQQSGLSISSDDQLSGKTSFRCTDMPIEEALKQLCRNTAFVYEYHPGSNSYRIISAGGYSGKPGNPAKPLPASPTPEREDKQFDKKGRRLYKPGELLVRYQKGATEKRISEFHKSLGSRVIGHSPRLRLQRIKLITGMTEEDAIKLYSDSGLFENVEKHAIRYLNTIPNDPSYNQQWGLSKIKAPDAWDITTGNPEIIIAVIDSGTDYSHPDLSDNVWTNPAELNGLDGVDDDANGYVDDIHGWDFAGDVSAITVGDNDPMDVYGHGTHVSGIIAAKSNNSIGISGLCWNVKIMPLKCVADDDDTKSLLEFPIIEAIEYAIDNGARIVNCSFGGYGPLVSEKTAFEGLETAGVISVCATGDNNVNADLDYNKTYPACYEIDSIISVAASHSDDTLASFSDYGLATVDVMAPGTDIWSTIPANSYAAYNGTSMATPHVTGVAGLLLSLNPLLDYSGLKSIIMDSVDRLPSVSDMLASGGRINALSAIHLLLTGDLTHDYQIDLEDAIVALQVLTFGSPPQLDASFRDVGGNDKIGLEEVVYILQRISALR